MGRAPIKHLQLKEEEKALSGMSNCSGGDSLPSLFGGRPPCLEGAFIMIKTCDAVFAFEEAVFHIVPYFLVCFQFPIGIAAVTKSAINISFIADDYSCKGELATGMLLQCSAATMGFFTCFFER